MRQDFIIGLDIGSSTIKAAVAEMTVDGKLSLLKIYKMPSRGIRKGVVDELAETTSAVNQLMSEIKNDYPTAHRNIFLNVGSPQVRTQSSRGIVAVSRADYEICQDDMDRVIQASQAVKLPPNRIILHSITREFVVDGVGEIRDPLGMIGNRLEANVLLVEAFSPAIKNLEKCLETNGGKVAGEIFGPLAGGRSILTKNKKELGVMVLDIGFGTTSLAVYEENKLVHATSLPFGSGNITNDLALGLKTSVETAEAIKFSFGAAFVKDVAARETVDLSRIDPKAKGKASRRFIAEIIEARLTEIFDHINQELAKVDRSAKLPAGVLLIGGGAKLPGLSDLAKQELRLPAQIGIPDGSLMDISNGELALQIEDPEFACCLGLLLWGGDSLSLSSGRQIPSSLRGAVRKVVNYFMP